MSEIWITVCKKTELTPNTGVCALVNEEQVAVFWEGISNELYALSNYDPIGEANVLSRGILGSVGDDMVVASPLYKQHFDLRTGDCLEQQGQQVPVYATRIDGDSVLVARR